MKNKQTKICTLLLSKMTDDELDFLLSSEGRKLLAMYADRTNFHQLALELHGQTEYSRTLVECLKIRGRAQKKFWHAKDMLMTRQSYEQASSDEVASYVSQSAKNRLAHSNTAVIYDLTAGLGTMSHHFAQWSEVQSIEIDPVLIRLARYNCQFYNHQNKVQWINGNCHNYLPKQADIIYIDPSRRQNHQRSSRLSYMEPNVFDLFPKLINITENIIIKTSPRIHQSEILHFSLTPEIEYISWNGIMREAILWFGKLKTTDIRGTQLPSRLSYTRNPIETHRTETLGTYIYEVDPAFRHQGILESVSKELGLDIISTSNRYLTSDNLITAPQCQSYRVIDICRSKTLKQTLQKHNIVAISIKKGQHHIDTEALQKKLKIPMSNTSFVFFVTIANKTQCIIAEKREN